jgi:CheY-like chemotaxis protein/anti-sigma regulatory factor (Ser/Thr protein kinase)
MDQDPDRLSQVMLNLLSNAIKYNRPHGRIAVRVQTSATGVRIEVEDTGLGMTAVQLDGLFQPFNRLGRESGQIAGSGIGMALARQLMDGLGGTVRVRSELDVGTTVTVELPRAELKPALDSSPGADRPVCALPSAAASPPRGLVLYIEDNPVNVLLVQEVLRAWPDVEFATTEGGLEGIALAAARYPALVLLDMQLPDLPGLEVLKRLKADPTTSGLCVVALSASAMAGDMAAALAAGAVDYWTKPIDVPAFRIAMRTLLVDAVVAHRQAVVEGRP